MIRTRQKLLRVIPWLSLDSIWSALVSVKAVDDLSAMVDSIEGVPEKAKERNKQRSREGSFIILVVSPVFYVMNF